MLERNFKVYQVIRYENSKLALASLLFFVIGYVAFTEVTFLIRVGSAMFSFLMLIFLIRRLFLFDYAVGFSEDGMVYNTSIIGQVYIPWESIDTISIVERKIRYVKNKYLVINAIDKTVLLECQDNYQRIMLRFFSPQSCSISALLLPIDEEELKDMVDVGVSNWRRSHVVGKNFT